VLILFLLVCDAYIWVLFFTYILFVAIRTFNTTLTEWLQHLQKGWARPEVPNLGYMYPWGYICLSEGVHLRLTIEAKYIVTYL